MRFLMIASVLALALSATSELQGQIPGGTPNGPDPPKASGTINIVAKSVLPFGGDKVTITVVAESEVTIEDGYGDSNNIIRTGQLMLVENNIEFPVAPLVGGGLVAHMKYTSVLDDNMVAEYTDNFVATYQGLTPSEDLAEGGYYYFRATLDIQAGGVGGVTELDKEVATIIIP